MAVDLNGIGRGQVNTQKTSTEKSPAQSTQQAAPEPSKAQATRGDSVSLSSQAKNLKQLEQGLDSFPEMDDERIEAIKAALADGSYKIDAEKLAQKMLDMDQSIFG
ncbi:flagellar biosynthesis anti-sigma factor FlgM [Marinobacter caseinilyticus]|uniref:flagellar biosynthesis anti-sigma factor FlgM n=1 Tax=Marinobacter caseinilyticus TaxID=2692195 RepID=UPI0014091FF5|nr:flagellar biosynthesis anti-sigma factor FlgM [Marinobacter caseinilyticus]